MLKAAIHYGIHFGLPLIIAILFYQKKFIKSLSLMMLGLLIDLDHLLANPVFDPNRCSINFHPLHSYECIALYILLLFPKKTRLIGLGLTVHILADLIDCQLL